MTIDRVGYGAEIANSRRLRMWSGCWSARRGAPWPQASGPQALTSHHVAVLECEIDDMNPQIFGALMDKLYGAGALEVFYSAVQMKKTGPAP